MAGVTHIGRVESIAGSQQQVIVDKLRNLLSAAERGEIKSVLWLADRFDQTFDIEWTPCDDLLQLSGQIARLQHRIQVRIDELGD